MDKLKNVFTIWEYKKEIEEYLGKSDTEGKATESMHMCIKELICKAVENALGFYPKRIRNKWLTINVRMLSKHVILCA
jgi:hypothetical protein